MPRGSRRGHARILRDLSRHRPEDADKDDGWTRRHCPVWFSDRAIPWPPSPAGILCRHAYSLGARATSRTCRAVRNRVGDGRRSGSFRCLLFVSFRSIVSMARSSRSRPVLARCDRSPEDGCVLIVPAAFRGLAAGARESGVASPDGGRRWAITKGRALSARRLPAPARRSRRSRRAFDEGRRAWRTPVTDLLPWPRNAVSGRGLAYGGLGASDGTPAPRLVLSIGGATLIGLGLLLVTGVWTR